MFTTRSTAIGLTLLLIISAASTIIFSQPTHAARAIIRDQALHIIDSRSSKRVPTTGAVSTIFADTGNIILFGTQTQSALPNSEDSGTIDLYITNANHQNKPLRLAGPVNHAILDLPHHLVYYTTPSAELHRINLDGTNDTALQNLVLLPAISPNGQQLIYQKLPTDWSPGQYYDHALGLTILDLTTRTEQRLTNNWEDSAATWSPNGTNIIFVSANDHGIASLFIIPVTGGNKRQLTNIGHDRVQPNTIPTPSEPPTWSSKNQDLIFESDHETWLISFNQTLSDVTTAKRLAFGTSPQWNTSGQSINLIVGNTNDPTQDLVEIDLTGKIIR